MTATAEPRTGLLRTLPGDSYSSPEVFRREQECIFETTWFAAALAGELAEPGAFRTAPVGRESVLIVRDRRGALRAFLNVCRHRGARLCVRETGKLRNAVRCAYHAWTYGLDGQLIAAPNLDALAGVDRSELALHPVHLWEWAGAVWVCLAETPPSFADTVIGEVGARLGGVDVLDSWQLDWLQLGKRVVYEVAANWKLIVENFMECYHCATIHPELTEVLPEFVEGHAAQSWVGRGAEFAQGALGFTVDGAPGFAALDGLDERHDRRYYAVTVNPQVFLNLVPDHVIFHRMYPVAVDRTIVECDWLFAPDVIASGADVSPSVELFHRVNQQDFDACERCQPAMSSRLYARGGVLVPTEHHIGAFHDWVTARLW
jgi:Rieske 2Fe-2S family protein